MFTFNYRNVFCALCNGVTPTRVAMDFFSGGGNNHVIPPSLVYSFSGLLRSSNQIMIERENRDAHCDHGFIYDIIKVKLAISIESVLRYLCC